MRRGDQAGGHATGKHGPARDPALPGPVGVDGRIIAFGAFAVLAAAAAVGRALWDADVLGMLGVPTHELAFVDARNITSAVECRADGHDPLLDNPCDPLGRPLNHPRVWLALRFFGVDQGWTVVFGVAFAAAFLSALYAVVGRLSSRQGLVLAAALCSPAVLFAVERGQNDLVVFALVAVTVTLWRRGATRRAAAPLPTVVAAVLKLFPAAALGAGLIGRQVRATLVAAASCVAVVIYLVATSDDLRAIATALPQGQHWAYGARILVSSAARAVDPDAWEALGAVRQVVAAAPLAVAVAAGWWMSRRLPAPPGPVSWRRHALHLAALVYVGTFASGNSWDYRLVFLLLALPEVFSWLRSGDARMRQIGAVVATVLVAQLWAGALLAGRTVADELLSWFLALGGSALLAADARGAWAWWRTGRPSG